jgi:hypothetical protein
VIAVASEAVRYVRRTAIWIPVVVIALLALPMALTNRTFGYDWTVHLWLVRQQQLNIESMSHPSLFISAHPFGVFYPMFAFVGSGLYTAGGCLAILLGGRTVLAYKLLYLCGLVSAYGGMTWLSVQLGLRSWRSQVPGLVVVTGAYFVTDFAGHGDLGEFVAVAAIPFVIAAGRSVFASKRIRARDLLSVVVAMFLFTGSHNITLMWGSIFIGFLTVIGFVAFAPAGLPPMPWSRLAALAGSGAIGAGLNAWYLFPDFRYGLDTVVAHEDAHHVPTVFAAPRFLLNPLRPTDPGSLPFGRDLRYSLPWMFALWALVAAVLLWRNQERLWRRAFIGVFGVLLVYLALLVRQGLWPSLPHVLYNLQFPSRLHAYVLLATALLVLLELRWQAIAPEPAKRATTIALVAFITFSVGAATWQVWRVRSEYVRRGREVVTGKSFADQVVAARYRAPVSWYPKEYFFRDMSARLVAPEASRWLTIPVTAVRDAKFAGELHVPQGALPFGTNIAAGPRFVTMTGIRPIGRTRDGWIVAVRSATGPTTGPINVTITQSDSALLRAGVDVSVVSAVLATALLLWALSRLAVERGSRRRERLRSLR